RVLRKRNGEVDEVGELRQDAQVAGIAFVEGAALLDLDGDVVVHDGAAQGLAQQEAGVDRAAGVGRRVARADEEAPGDRVGGALQVAARAGDPEVLRDG